MLDILDALRAGYCPDCTGETFLMGPEGGLMQNIKCDMCGSTFNWCPPCFYAREGKADRIGKVPNPSLIGLHLLQRRLEKFQQTRFPDQQLSGRLNHLAREVKELIENPGDKNEWADVLNLLLGCASMANISATELVNFGTEKLAICEQRKWGPADADGVHHHLEEVENPS